MAGPAAVKLVGFDVSRSYSSRKLEHPFWVPLLHFRPVLEGPVNVPLQVISPFLRSEDISSLDHLCGPGRISEASRHPVERGLVVELVHLAESDEAANYAAVDKI